MRWRDVKQGKVEPKEEKVKLAPSNIPPIASIPDRMKAFITDSFMLLMPLMYFVFYIIMGSREEFAENMAAGWAYIFIPHFIIVMHFFGNSKAKHQDIKTTTLSFLIMKETLLPYFNSFSDTFSLHSPYPSSPVFALDSSEKIKRTCTTFFQVPCLP